MPVDDFHYPILSQFLCVVESWTGQAMPAAVEPLTSAGALVYSSAPIMPTPTPTPTTSTAPDSGSQADRKQPAKGVVLDKDGKP